MNIKIDELCRYQDIAVYVIDVTIICRYRNQNVDILEFEEKT